LISFLFRHASQCAIKISDQKRFGKCNLAAHGVWCICASLPQGVNRPRHIRATPCQAYGRAYRTAACSVQTTRHCSNTSHLCSNCSCAPIEPLPCFCRATLLSFQKSLEGVFNHV
jgi:hypothetical protein